MNREDIFLAVSELRPELILEAETVEPKRRSTVQILRWCAAAAAFVLIAGAVFALPKLRHAAAAPQPGGVPGTEVYWTELPQSVAGDPQPVGVPGPDAILPEAAETVVLAWNELDETRGRLESDKAGVVMVGELLTAAQTAACAPEIREAWMAQFNGSASYYLITGEGGLAYIDLTVTNAAWGGVSSIRIRGKDAPEYNDCIVWRPETDKVGSCGGQEYRAYRCAYYHGEGDPKVDPPEPWTELTVIFEKENVEYTLRANVPQTQEELAAADLRDLLLCYAGTHNVPDLSAFRCGEHVYRDEELTFAGALADPDFGAYLPAAGPEGFEPVQMRRYQLDDTVNILTAFWFRDRGELVWRIEPANTEALARVVDPAEPETYDWNRYPVPWSAYAAQENWLTIANPVFRSGDLTPELISTRVHTGDEGLLMCRFGVLFESGVLVEINAKDVSPDWICAALEQIGCV